MQATTNSELRDGLTGESKLGDGGDGGVADRQEDKGETATVNRGEAMVERGSLAEACGDLPTARIDWPAARIDGPAAPVRGASMLTIGSLELDLAILSPADQAELTKRAALTQIELAKKAGELGLENQAMEKRIGDMAHTVAAATQGGASATITGAYEDRLGRTEVIMGNTETAARGKLTRSQQGESSTGIWYLAIVAVVIVVIAICSV